MRRFLFRLAAPALLGLVVPLSVLAQEAPAAHRPGHRHLKECLSILELTDQQRMDIQAIVDAAKPTVEADVAAVAVARQTLRAAVDAVPPEACAIGNDLLAVKAAIAMLRAEREAVRNQVLATLTPDQQARLQGCLDAPRPEAVAADETAE
jgi:Spy/CpxP family protein refolding chaperone